MYNLFNFHDLTKAVWNQKKDWHTLVCIEFCSFYHFCNISVEKQQ
jgi:hypothetical protein